MVIRILDIVTSADTGEQGAAVFASVSQALAADAEVVVSFCGVTTATSSFVNLAFVQLLSTFPLAAIKRRLRIVDSTRQINDLIRTRMDRESGGAPRHSSGHFRILHA